MAVEERDGDGVEEIDGEIDIAVEEHEWKTAVRRLDREDLKKFGEILDKRPGRMGGRPTIVDLAEKLLVVRSRYGRPVKL